MRFPRWIVQHFIERQPDYFWVSAHDASLLDGAFRHADMATVVEPAQRIGAMPRVERLVFGKRDGCFTVDAAIASRACAVRTHRWKLHRSPFNLRRGREIVLADAHDNPLPAFQNGFYFRLAVAKLQGMVTMSERLANAFTRNVRERMQELGINQGELADRLKVGKSFVSQMLSGHRRPGLDSLDSWAKALELEPADLLREKKFSKTA